MKPAKILTLALLCLWLPLPPGFAQNCADFFALVPDTYSRTEILALRAGLATGLKAEGVPVFLKETSTGKIPVILMNADTAGRVQPLLDNSLGTQIQLQLNWNNDHGMFRLTNRLIDMDLPGQRGFGELHGTGLAWKPLPSYLARRQEGAYPILEVAYALTKQEREAAEYYHRSRRGALFRVKFTFGNAQNRNDLPNTLQGGGEHCFIFCKGSSVGSHVSEMQGMLRQQGVADVPAYMQTPEVRRFLSDARKKMLSVNADSADALSPATIGSDPALLTVLDPVIPAVIRGNPEKVRDFANLLVGLDASAEYRQLLDTLQVSSDVAVRDMNHPRATAVFVYDSPARSSEFDKATYQTKGKFYEWMATGQMPVEAPIPHGLKPAAPPIQRLFGN